MSSFNRPHDDIYYEVSGMDLFDVYKEAQNEPVVNGLLKKFYYAMRDPQYLEWRLNNDQRVVSDEMRQDILRNKLESIKRCERISKYLDEQGIGLNTYNTWSKRFNKKNNKKEIEQSTIPEWIRKSSKRCSDDKSIEVEEIDVAKEIDNLANGEALEEMKAKRAMLRPSKKSDLEKKPKRNESSE